MTASEEGEPPLHASALLERKQQRWWLQCGVGCVVLLLVGLVTFLVLFFTLRSHTRVYDVLQLDEKPQADPRNYQHAVLKNGLKVLSIQDPSSRFAAFALAVEAGSDDDPRELPGLAHLCEHMLFLGTERFPKVGEYRSYLAEHGGNQNAFTARGVTVYYAEVAHNAAEGALDRFADFFRAPLFRPEYVEKEVHAVDSEHAKNVQNPHRRVFETLHALANPASPGSRFHTGNLETLWKGPQQRNISAADEVRSWFQGHYCASRMHLVTLGPMPLSEQLELARKHFSELPAVRAECQRDKRVLPPPWPRERMGKWVLMQSAGAQPEPELWLHFSLPNLRPHYQSQPLDYVSYLISYGGEHSLQRVLSDSLGLISSLKVRNDKANDGANLFVVLRLTPLGHENLQLLLHVVFAYLAMARHMGVDRQLYSTLADVERLQWDWAQPGRPSHTVSTFAERMTRIPREHLLFGDSRIDVQDASAVFSLLEMLRPDNMNALLVSPTAEQNLTFREQAIELPHYGVRYRVQSLTEVLGARSVAQWDAWLNGTADASALNAAIVAAVREAGVRAVAPPYVMVPGPIAGVPTSIALAHMRAAPAPPSEDIVGAMFGLRPVRVDSMVGVRAGLRKKDVEVWFRDGWMTKSPEVRLVVCLRPLRTQDEPEPSPQDILRISMYSRLLMEELLPKTYDTSMTGASYNLDVTMQGLELTFSGFAQVMPQLIERVVDVFKRFNVVGNVTGLELERFHRIRQHLEAELNSYSAMPSTYAMQDLSLLLLPGMASAEEKLAAFSGITPEAAKAAAGELLFGRRLQTTALAMGNFGEQAALEALEACVSGIVSGMGGVGTAHSDGKVQHTPPVVRVTRPIELRRLNPRKDDTNQAVVVSLVLGVSSVESRVHASLLAHILDPLSFSELRSKRQLGYVVHSGTAVLSNVLSLNVIVQSSILNADELEAAVESVLMGLLPERLFNLTEYDILSYKLALKQSLLQPPSSYAAESEHFWGSIAKGGACFRLRDEMLRYIEGPAVTRESLMEEWSKIADPNLGTRAKVVIKLFAGTVPGRPDVRAATQLWKQHGVPETAWPLLQREHQQFVLLDRADASSRLRLAALSGYYPQDLYCERGAGQKPLPGSMVVGQNTSGPHEETAARSLRRRTGPEGAQGALVPHG